MDKATCRRCSGVLNMGAMHDEGPKCRFRGDVKGLGLEARLQHASSLLSLLSPRLLRVLQAIDWTLR